MRLDKFLTQTTQLTRSQAKQALKKGEVTVNHSIVKSGKEKINEQQDSIVLKGQLLHYQPYYYYMLHKPKDVISATKDSQKTVLDLLKKTEYREDLFPVGRLDKDTEGLLLLTNDGALAHDLLSPKKHVEKEYFASINGIVTTKEVIAFQNGLLLEGKEAVKSAALRILSTDEKTNTSTISLVLHEGKFHQVKRMFQTVGMEVTYLKRIRMGELTLGNLPLGHYRLLSEKEIESLFQLNKKA